MGAFGSPTPANPIVELLPIRRSYPAIPSGLGTVVLKDPNTLDISGTAPVLKWGGCTYWAYSFIDNRVALAIVAYDVSGNIVGRWDKWGARYIWQITVDSDARKVTFWGQSRNTVEMSWDELDELAVPKDAIDESAVSLKGATDELSTISKERKLRLIGLCLTVVQNTPDRGLNTIDHQRSEAEPHIKLRQILDDLVFNDSEPSLEQMQEALEILKIIFYVKNTPIQEQIERFNEIFAQTGTRGLFPDFEMPA